MIIDHLRNSIHICIGYLRMLKGLTNLVFANTVTLAEHKKKSIKYFHSPHARKTPKNPEDPRGFRKQENTRAPRVLPARGGWSQSEIPSQLARWQPWDIMGRDKRSLAIRQVTLSGHELLLFLVLQDGHCFQVTCTPNLLCLWFQMFSSVCVMAVLLFMLHIQVGDPGRL